MSIHKNIGTFIPEIPDSFWDIYEAARTEQLIYFGMTSEEAREFAKEEIETRQRISKKHGPEHAIFAVWERFEFPLDGRGSLGLRVLFDGPFNEDPEDIR
jgi:hypothetical protein